MAQAKSKAKRTNKSSKKKNPGVLLWIHNHKIVIPIFFVILFGGIAAWQLNSSKAAVLSTTIDVWNRDAVNNAYKSLWASGANTNSGWTGSVTGCKPGNITESARLAQVNAVNFIRRVNNLSPVAAARLTDTAHLNTQKTALIMDTSNKLSHYPDSSFGCRTEVGVETAGKSNLALSTPSIKPVQAIKLYMDDPGSTNTAAGHRRWLMYPDAEVFAFGMTEQASALQVLGLRTNTDNNDPLYTMWPSRGHFPVTLEPNGRWSVSTKANVTLKYASVTVRKSSATGPVVPITRYGIHEGYGRSTLVWQMPKDFAKSGPYYVTVKGAKIVGSSTLDDYTYPVFFFTPY